MTVRVHFTRSGSVLSQSIKEFCEHCDEFVRKIHVSDIAEKKESDPRTIRVEKEDRSTFVLKTKQERIREVTASYKERGLLDDVEAAEAFQNKKLKYGLRPEAMCSESIDLDAEVTRSFCFRVTNPKFLAKTKSDGTSFSASFHAADEIKANATGSKVGMDRKGNIIRIKRAKQLDMAAPEINGKRIVKKDAEDREVEKYETAWKVQWWREAEDAGRTTDYIERIQRCEGFIEAYGADSVKDLTVIENFRSENDFRTALDRYRCS